MKGPQQAGGRTDQMLGAIGDILTSLALPSQHWLPDPCSQEQGAEMQPQAARSSTEASEDHRKQHQMEEMEAQQEAMASGAPGAQAVDK
ncbi:hypothetical protein lerEdw1_006630, partial [Lerista edwardsae]